MIIVLNINSCWNIYNFRLGLVKSLQKAGHKVIAVAPKDVYTKKLEKEGLVHYDVVMNKKGTNPIQDLKLLFSYVSIFKKIKPDLILSYTIKPNTYGNLAAGYLNIPVINTITGLGTVFIKKTISTLVAKLLYGLSLRFSSHTYFQNIDDLRFFVRLKLVAKKKSSVMPGSGVNTQLYSCQRISNKGQSFLFVGRLLADKGIYEFLSAVKMILRIHRDVQFLIVGELDAINRTAISKVDFENILKNTTQVKYLGKSEDMISVYKQADVMVLPSYREGLSKSLIEAAAMSLPIITTNVPGCRDVVTHMENGLLCVPRDAESLAEAMISMISFSEKRRLDMGRNGRKLVEQTFRDQLIILKYLQRIEQIRWAKYNKKIAH